MSQIVGWHNGVDRSRNNIIRSPLLTIPSGAYADSRSLNISYAQQSVQATDDFGNAAAHVRIANGGYRTVQRVINVSLNGGAVKTVRLVNNVGSGTLGFTRIDGYAAPAGFVKLLDARTLTDAFILSPGMSISLDPNMHSISFQGVGCDVNSYLVISYAMEIYISNIVFDVLPAAGEFISFGDFAVFEAYANGVPGTVEPNRIGVELPLSASVADFCDNLVTAFNTTYVAAVEPAGSQTPFHWARKIATEDLITYRDSATGTWLDATDKGVQFNSVNAAMIRNTLTNIAVPNAQIIKQL